MDKGDTEANAYHQSLKFEIGKELLQAQKEQNIPAIEKWQGKLDQIQREEHRFDVHVRLKINFDIFPIPFRFTDIKSLVQIVLIMSPFLVRPDRLQRQGPD